MNTYQAEINNAAAVIDQYGNSWRNINPESVARMRLQNRFKTGLDIARYTAGIMRADMAAYDRDPAQYTQSLGCWHQSLVHCQTSPCMKKPLCPP